MTINLMEEKNTISLLNLEKKASNTLISPSLDTQGRVKRADSFSENSQPEESIEADLPEDNLNPKKSLPPLKNTPQSNNGTNLVSREDSIITEKSIKESIEGRSVSSNKRLQIKRNTDRLLQEIEGINMFRHNSASNMPKQVKRVLPKIKKTNSFVKFTQPKEKPVNIAHIPKSTKKPRKKARNDYQFQKEENFRLREQLNSLDQQLVFHIEKLMKLENKHEEPINREELEIKEVNNYQKILSNYHKEYSELVKKVSSISDVNFLMDHRSEIEKTEQDIKKEKMKALVVKRQIKVRESLNFRHLKEVKEGKDMNKILSCDLDYQIQIVNKNRTKLENNYKTIASSIRNNAREVAFLQEKHASLVEMAANYGIDNEKEELSYERKKKFRILTKRLKVLENAKEVQSKKYLNVIAELESETDKQELKIKKLIGILERIEQVTE